ncbi:MAG: IS110 family transposase [Deltaproteobacteria bacterium]|nr:IS110 family transposase [Deltaproteobacteria bacterium]
MREKGYFVGIDVSKAFLDVAVALEGKSWRVSNDQAGIAHLVERLKAMSPEVVVLEASGGYEMLVVGAMGVANLPVARVNPRHVRDFAKASGRLAKTDKIDAFVLASFGEVMRPEVRPLKDEQSQELQALLTRRSQLVEMLISEKNRLGTCLEKRVRKDIMKHISWLKKRIEEVEKDLESRIKASPIWREKEAIMRSVPGVGPILSLTLLAELPELGTLSHKKISSLVGLAPFNCDSGKFKGKRRIWGGRAKVRTALFMATMAATRFNPIIRSFYQRLLLAGKPFKVAITACMHKLLIILNAMMHHRSLWLSRNST